ncbi:CorA metal ion transporter [Rhizoclosmatium sp. JEL0117]|nr:CorA metal ion transporter [Rhizoclosmatium sp. JEL0117]
MSMKGASRLSTSSDNERAPLLLRDSTTSNSVELEPELEREHAQSPTVPLSLGPVGPVTQTQIRDWSSPVPRRSSDVLAIIASAESFQRDLNFVSHPQSQSHGLGHPLAQKQDQFHTRKHSPPPRLASSASSANTPTLPQQHHLNTHPYAQSNDSFLDTKSSSSSNLSMSLPHLSPQQMLNFSRLAAEEGADVAAFGSPSPVTGPGASLAAVGSANSQQRLSQHQHSPVPRMHNRDQRQPQHFQNHDEIIADDVTEEGDRDSNYPFRISHQLDYDAIADYLTSATHDSTEFYTSYHTHTTQHLQKQRRETRHQHPDWYYHQQHQRFTFHSDATETIQSPYFETLPFTTTFDRPVNEILRAGPFWLDVCNPTPEEMSTLARVFRIHPLTTEDIQTEETREKCETFPGYYFITIRSFDADAYSMTYMQPINVYIVVFRECVLSFHSQPIIHLNNVLRRIEQLKVYGMSISPDWLNYALIDDITDGFMPSLRHIELEVDAIDELVLILKDREQSDMLRRIGHARKKVMMLLRLLITKTDVIKAVIKRCAQRLAPDSETTLYLGDIQDHILTMVQTLNHCEKTLTRSHSNYLAQISIELTQASNRTNDVVMKMTALASILVPLNIITGLFGMNVKVPGEEGETLVWFFCIVGFMAFLAFVSYIWLRKNLH